MFPSQSPLSELQFPAYLGPEQLPACLLSLLLEAFLELLSLALLLSQGVLQLLKLLLWHHVVHLGLGLLQLQSVLGLGQAQAGFGFQKLQHRMVDSWVQRWADKGTGPGCVLGERRALSLRAAVLLTGQSRARD